MKPETTLSLKQMRNFSINVTNTLEGCPEATVFLKKIYGERTKDLTFCRPDFLHLIKAKKQRWVLNFLLNTITKEFRVRFLHKLLSENLYLMFTERDRELVDKALSIGLGLYTDPSFSINGLDIVLEELRYLRDIVKVEISNVDQKDNELHFDGLQSQSQYLKAVITFLSNLHGTCTRTSVEAIASLAESQQWDSVLNPSSEPYEEALNQHTLSLIDYVGYFVDTEKKELPND